MVFKRARHEPPPLANEGGGHIVSRIALYGFPFKFKSYRGVTVDQLAEGVLES